MRKIKNYAYKAYDEMYLSFFMNSMGLMLDYACVDNDYNPDTFFRMFIDSGIARLVEIGDVSIISGKSGIEIANMVFEYYGLDDALFTPTIKHNKTEIYWCGYVLAYYQWYSSKRFIEIWEHLSLLELKDLYYPYHEADISKIVEIIDKKINKIDKKPLQELRLAKGLTQKELAKRANMDISQIQRLEYGERKTENLSLKTAINLAFALGVDVKEL